MKKVYSQALQFIGIVMLIFCLLLNGKLTAQSRIVLSAAISSGLSAPIQVVNAGDGTNRIFVVQQGGTIRVYDQSFGFLGVFLTVSGVATGGEQGLLSMVFHPSYATNGFFYVYYTNSAGNLEVARYHVSANANAADAASKVVVLTIPHPTNSNHNGGEMHFGSDGYLYMSTGDGGGGGDQSNNAQNTAVQLGKILRLAVNESATAPFYTAAPGNPFSNNVYAYGLRNPFRWSFDRVTNDIWIGDVGQNSWEEINFRAAGSISGANFGWRCYEGNNTYNTSGCGDISNYVFPAYTYATQDPMAAVTGGCVYRGNNATLYGYYVAADFYSGNFYIVSPNGSGGWNTSLQAAVQTGIADFGETEDGELLAASLTGNTVYRVLTTSDGPLPVTLANFTAVKNNGLAELRWKTSMEQNLDHFEIQYSTNGIDFIKAGIVAAKNNPSGADYVYSHVTPVRGLVYYRLKMVDKDGSFKYSLINKVDFTRLSKDFVSPSVITNNTMNVNLTESYKVLELVNQSGSVLMQRKITGLSGNINVPIPVLANGIYLVRLSGDNKKTLVQKIMLQQR
ncbi:MAG: PQQ-dependent sugar dehydrogenase [Ferruginibacter sp.]